MPFVKSFRDGTLTLSDGAGTPVTTVVDYAEGDFSAEMTRNVNVLTNRGALLDLKSGDKAPIAVTFSLKLDNLNVLANPPETKTVLTIAHPSSFTDIFPARQGTQSPADTTDFSSSGVGRLLDLADPSRSEIFTWSSKNSTTLQGVTRGAHGTTALDFAQFDRVYEFDLAERRVYEFLERRGGFAGLTSTRDASTDVFTCDLIFSMTDQDDNVEETDTFEDFYLEKLETSEGDEYSILKVSGRCWSTDVVTT